MSQTLCHILYTVYKSYKPFFNYFFIKNDFHIIIYIFKNYFIMVFLVFNYIQMDFNYQLLELKKGRKRQMG